ncbi:MAG: TolC family protein [Bdellovibrionota bacterium]
MIRSALCAIAVLLCFESAGALTLQEAQQIALSNNPELKASHTEVDADEAALTRSSSRFYPRFGVESRYEYFDSAFERRRGGTGNLFAEWNLFNGLQDVSARQARKLDVEVSRLRFALTKQKVIWAVESAFGKVLALQETIALHDAALDRNLANQKAARGRRAAGVVSDADVLEFDLYESILRADLAAAQGDLKAAEAEFRKVLGDDSVEFPLVGQIQRYQLNSKLEAIVADLPQTNAEIRTTQMDVQRAEAEVKVATAGFLPQVRAFASYGSLGLRETQISPETYAGVVARWELFSGFDTIGARHEARHRVVHAESDLKAAQIAQKGEAEETFARIKSLEFRIQLEERNHETAHRYMRTVIDEYRRGVKNSPDLKNATDNVLRSHLREVNLRAEYLDQAMALNTITGGRAIFEKLKTEERKEEK